VGAKNLAANQVLRDARAAPPTGGLEAHREAVLVLRRKGYTWRDIAAFLKARGVATDHTKVFRLIKGRNAMIAVTVPGFEQYRNALSTLTITDKQREMLKAHYDSPNRSITYRALATAAGFKDYRVANLQYGKLGAALGKALGFQFQKFGDSDVDFMTSAIAMPTDRHYWAGDEFEIVMHHELSRALDDLHWFKN
jgi:hypothetical protein